MCAPLDRHWPPLDSLPPPVCLFYSWKWISAEDSDLLNPPRLMRTSLNVYVGANYFKLCHLLANFVCYEGFICYCALFIFCDYFVYRFYYVNNIMLIIMYNVECYHNSNHMYCFVHVLLNNAIILERDQLKHKYPRTRCIYINYCYFCSSTISSY